jgi:hypothetical protein
VKRSSTLLLLTLLLAGCGNAGEDLAFGVKKANGINVLVYFDRDGSGDYTPPPGGIDTTASGIWLKLLRLNTIVPADSDTTNAAGILKFAEVDPGYYGVVVDTARLGDSIVATRIPVVATVQAGGIAPQVQISLAPPFFTLQGVRSVPFGKTVLIGGVITAGRQSFGDGSAYLQDAGAALRIQTVRNLNNNPGNQGGDVVRVRGVVSLFNGEVVLDSTRVYLAANHAEPLPDNLGTGAAASAAGGSDDARLVHIAGATVKDTTRAGAVFTAGVDDGSGRVEIRVDPLLFVTSTTFNPDTAVVDVTGVLVPTGTGTWQLWPRTRDDIVIH